MKLVQSQPQGGIMGVLLGKIFITIITIAFGYFLYEMTVNPYNIGSDDGYVPFYLWLFELVCFLAIVIAWVKSLLHKPNRPQ